MRDYVIFTDSCASLSQQEVDELQVKVVSLSVLLNGKNYIDLPDHSSISMEDFYAGIKNGESCKTSAPNLQDFLDKMEPVLQEGKDILYIGFSSALSSTYHTGTMAAEELMEKYPGSKILTVDSLCACRGLGMLVWRTVKEMKETGKTLEEAYEFAKREKENQAHWFFVDDLDRLKQGGRVSAIAAVFGGLLAIKPVMHCDSEGRLTLVSKVRGIKAAIKALADKMEADGIRPLSGKPVFICNARCQDYVAELEKVLTERFGKLDFHVGDICPVVGGHTGLGTVGLFFIADKR